MAWRGMSAPTHIATATQHQSTIGPQTANSEGQATMCSTMDQMARGRNGPRASIHLIWGTNGGGTKTLKRTGTLDVSSSAATTNWWPNVVAASAAVTAAVDGTSLTTRSSPRTVALGAPRMPHAPGSGGRHGSRGRGPKRPSPPVPTGARPLPRTTPQSCFRPGWRTGCEGSFRS
jgi:hypothetical protein